MKNVTINSVLTAKWVFITISKCLNLRDIREGKLHHNYICLSITILSIQTCYLWAIWACVWCGQSASRNVSSFWPKYPAKLLHHYIWESNQCIWNQLPLHCIFSESFKGHQQNSGYILTNTKSTAQMPKLCVNKMLLKLLLEYWKLRVWGINKPRPVWKLGDEKTET